MNPLTRYEQPLPAKWEDREKLRTKGQFWTPQWLARGMVRWVLASDGQDLFDPAVGPGTFFLAARDIGFRGTFSGFELDADILSQTLQSRLFETDIEKIIVGDFLTTQINLLYKSIISNPPYIRHHRLSLKTKEFLRAQAIKILGFPLDGRTGLHVYFLLKALNLLSQGGRLAFLLPSDVCEGVSSSRLWHSITSKFCLEAVITFDEDSAPFPNVDTNAMVFLISKNNPSKSIRWSCVHKPSTKAFLHAVALEESDGATICFRDVPELLSTGLSRRPKTLDEKKGLPLVEFAKVMRGIATGANEFFFMTSKDIRKKRIPKRFFVRAIGRTRDCPSNSLELKQLDKLDKNQRPTWLLSIGKVEKEKLPEPLQKYLEQGEKLKINERSLIKARKPWYSMEIRKTPPILFAYLGRRDSRFIENKTDCVPLTGFLCIYPKTGIDSKALCCALNHAATIANLKFAGKSYGKGALKLEPRQLDRLLIPEQVVEANQIKTFFLY